MVIMLGCKPESTSYSRSSAGTKVSEAPLNVVVLLDLSNRLITTEGQVEKDQAILSRILDIFELHQKKQAFITSKDRLSLLVASQPGVVAASNDSLAIDMEEMRTNPSKQGRVGLQAFKEAKERFQYALGDLYSKALNSPYTGADIYSFFCNEFPTNFIRKGARNKLIVLTDGYLLFDAAYLSKRPECTYMRQLDKLRGAKANWQAYFEKQNLALCPCAGRAYPDTEVLMLETAPLNRGTSVYEIPIVEYYWTQWFESMGVPALVYPREDIVANIKEKLEVFLQ